MPLACLMRISRVLQGGSSGLFAAAQGAIACQVLPASTVACSRQKTALYPHVAARLRGVAMCGVAHVQCPSASAIPAATSPNGLQSVSACLACTAPH